MWTGLGINLCIPFSYILQLSPVDIIVLSSSSEDDATPPPPRWRLVTVSPYGLEPEQKKSRVQAAMEAEDVSMDTSTPPPPAQPHQTHQPMTPSSEASSPLVCRLLTPTRDFATQTEKLGDKAPLFWTMMEWLERSQVKTGIFFHPSTMSEVYVFTFRSFSFNLFYNFLVQNPELQQFLYIFIGKMTYCFLFRI